MTRMINRAGVSWASRSVRDLVETYPSQVLADPSTDPEIDDAWLDLVLAEA